MSVSRETIDRLVSRETADRLAVYVKLLLRWNIKINLISQHDIGVIWTRHIEDCLQLVPLIPAGTKMGIDLGAGGGLPGLVVALTSGIPFTLIEADLRKAEFLREAARQTEAPVRVLAKRIEDASIAPADLVTARALAPLPRLMNLAMPHLAAGGTLLFLKGSRVDVEIEAVKTQWTMMIERHISHSGRGGVILRITGVQRA